MISVLTGDIIRSREYAHPEIWLKSLKKALSQLEQDTSLWEIYRGDSFQIEISDPYNSFEAAVYIKACIKMIKGLDVRIAIGVGNKTYQGKDVTESNGEAFVFSGQTFEALKIDKHNLHIKTKDRNFNDEINLYFTLASTIMDNWTIKSAEIVKLSLEHPDWLQQDLANHINISQNAVSKRQHRAYLFDILQLNAMFKKKLNQLHL